MGMSIVERIFDRLTSYDSTSVGAAQLAYKAHLRTAKIKKLREIIATGGKAFEALIKNMEMVRQYQTNEGMSCLIRRTNLKHIPILSQGCLTCLASLKRISRVLLAFLLSVCSASHRRVFQPVTLTSRTTTTTGALRERDLRPHIRLLFDVLHRSEFGEPLPQDFTFEFNPGQMSDTDRSTVATNTTTALATAVRDLGMSPAAALTDLRELSDVTGIGASISDEDIQNAAKQWQETESETSPPPPIGGPVPEKPTSDSRPDKPNRHGLLRWFTGKR